MTRQAPEVTTYRKDAEQLQIAVKEALPLQEFKYNPFAVLCTTSLGGHLSWFETGGERWFAKPVSKPGVHLEAPLLTKNLGKPVLHENGSRGQSQRTGGRKEPYHLK